jgi:Tfp pilus assembly protein PilF/TolB-like protein
VALAACASGLPNVQPADLPRLESEARANPTDTDLQVQLGVAQYRAGNLEDARETLDAAVEAGNHSGPAYLYLGMVQEDLQDWSAARRAYNRYLVVGASGPAREEVRERLTLIGRNILRVQSQQALAQEQEITATGQITPRSVAVMPLAFNSNREDLEPLIYALSDMMITDFKISNALVVLERAQVQTLLDEMALTSSGYADAATGARAGRLLRAEHVFQGVLTTLGESDLQTEADVLNIPNTSSAGQFTESAVLERLFDMEKQIVIRTIREVLGVALTPAEEQAILENRMSNVLAFLAYGRGLRELDQGNYDAAQAEFQAALALDPTSAKHMQSAMAETASLVASNRATTSDLAGLAGRTGEWGNGFLAPPAANTTEGLTSIGIADRAPIGAGSTDPTGSTPRSTYATLTNVSEGVLPTATATTLGLGSAEQSRNPTPGQAQPTTREPIQEGQGQESVPGTAQAQIRIIILRPGGEE